MYQMVFLLLAFLASPVAAQLSSSKAFIESALPQIQPFRGAPSVITQVDEAILSLYIETGQLERVLNECNPAIWHLQHLELFCRAAGFFGASDRFTGDIMMLQKQRRIELESQHLSVNLDQRCRQQMELGKVLKLVQDGHWKEAGAQLAQLKQSSAAVDVIAYRLTTDIQRVHGTDALHQFLLAFHGPTENLVFALKVTTSEQIQSVIHSFGTTHPEIVAEVAVRAFRFSISPSAERRELAAKVLAFIDHARNRIPDALGFAVDCELMGSGYLTEPRLKEVSQRCRTVWPRLCTVVDTECRRHYLAGLAIAKDVAAIEDSKAHLSEKEDLQYANVALAQAYANSGNSDAVVRQLNSLVLMQVPRTARYEVIRTACKIQAYDLADLLISTYEQTENTEPTWLTVTPVELRLIVALERATTQNVDSLREQANQIIQLSRAERGRVLRRFPVDSWLAEKIVQGEMEAAKKVADMLPDELVERDGPLSTSARFWPIVLLAKEQRWDDARQFTIFITSRHDIGKHLQHFFRELQSHASTDEHRRLINDIADASENPEVKTLIAWQMALFHSDLAAATKIVAVDSVPLSIPNQLDVKRLIDNGWESLALSTIVKQKRETTDAQSLISDLVNELGRRGDVHRGEAFCAQLDKSPLQLLRMAKACVAATPFSIASDR